jgi:hypothetical protein
MEYPLYRVSKEEIDQYPTGPCPLPSATIASADSTRQYPPASGGAEAYPGIHKQISSTRHTGKSSLLLVSLLVLALIIATGGGAFYILTHPRPTLSLNSSYMVGQTPAGATGTELHISGQDFSRQTAITFLLDGKPAPGAPEAISDMSGKINVILLVTPTWPVGKHTLSARDDRYNFNQINIPLEIVKQGQANTPGPLGAPPDDASFVTSLSIQGKYEAANAQPLSGNEKLVITGHAYPNEGSICKANDTGHPHQYSTKTSNGIPLTEVMTTTCTGTYKSGSITYTQILLTDAITLNDNGTQISCNLTKSGPEERLTGSYTAQGTFHGTVQYVSFPDTDFACNTGSLGTFQFYLYGGHGTWVGSIIKG